MAQEQVAATRWGRAVINCSGISPESCAGCPLNNGECERVWEVAVPDETTKLQSREKLKAILSGRA
jgi:hypothetical protein